MRKKQTKKQPPGFEPASTVPGSDALTTQPNPRTKLGGGRSVCIGGALGALFKLPGRLRATLNTATNAPNGSEIWGRTFSPQPTLQMSGRFSGRFSCRFFCLFLHHANSLKHRVFSRKFSKSPRTLCFTVFPTGWFLFSTQILMYPFVARARR